MGIWDNAFRLPGRGKVRDEEKALLRSLAAKVNGTSFTINLGTVTTNPACFEYFIIGN